VILDARYDARMTQRVRVTTGARLHFGPLAVGAQKGRTFGGVGLMIDTPGWQIDLERSEQDAVCAADQTERITGFRERFRRNSTTRVPSCRITVTRHMLSHAGLGSGTQLALAVARGLAALAGDVDIDAIQLAQRTERGQRSAIGTHGFAAGGFLVDAGRPVSGELGALACRLEMPADWRFLLASPQQSTGLSGSSEQRAFESLAPMPDETTAELCRIVVMDWLPAVQSADFPGFCAALDAFGGLVGEYFHPVQGGVFTDEAMASLAAELHAAGIHGIAQSSWGPTIAICCPHSNAAEELQSTLSADPKWSHCEFRVVRPLNEGAHVVVES